MAIISIKTESVGEVGSTARPRWVKLISTDDLATVTTEGYLNSTALNGFILIPSDVIFCQYSFNEATQVGTLGIFIPTFTGPSDSQTIRLDLWENLGNVQLPVTDGHFAMFSGTTGLVGDDGFFPSNPIYKTVPTVDLDTPPVVNYIASFSDTEGTIRNTANTIVHPGDINAGLSGTAGEFVSYPSTASRGRLVFQAQDNSGNFSVAIKNGPHSQAANYFLNDIGTQQNSILTSSLTSAEANSNLLWVDVTAGYLDLTLSGTVTVVASSGTAQYKIREVFLNATGTDFDGGGGNRSIRIGDGTTDWALVPASTIQNLGTNYRWGVPELPFTSSNATAASQPGADIVISYIGGTIDYATAGSLTLTICYEKVAD